MLNKYKDFFGSSFVKKLTIMMTGTIVGQLIPVVASVVLTRVYSPNVFGVYATFIAVSMIYYSVFSFSMDQAISISKNFEDSITLFVLNCLILGSINIVVYAILFFYGENIASILGFSGNTTVLLLMPIYASLYGIYMCIYFIYIRWSEIKNSSRLRMVMPTFVVLSNFAYIVVNTDDNSLVISQVFAFFFLIIFQIIPFAKCCKKNHYHFTQFRINNLIPTALMYKNFPLKFMPSILLNNISIQIPNILFNQLFGSIVGGYYSLVNKTLNMPVSAVGVAFGDVFRNEAYIEKEKTGKFNVSFNQTIKILIIFGVVPFLIIFLFGETIFSMVFGENWVSAGEMATCLTFMYLVRFICVPLSYSIVLCEKHKVNILLQFSLVVSTFLSFFIGYFVFSNWKIVAILYSTCYAIIYIFVTMYARKLSFS